MTGPIGKDTRVRLKFCFCHQLQIVGTFFNKSHCHQLAFLSGPVDLVRTNRSIQFVSETQIIWWYIVYFLCSVLRIVLGASCNNLEMDIAEELIFASIIGMLLY